MDITLTDVSLTYMRNTPFEKAALEDIHLYIPKNQMVGLIGHTGSGKSSLIQLIGGLFFPDKGMIKVGSYEWNHQKKNLYDLRRQIGLVFQYPEHQLFEETVEKDIAFGPRNFQFSEEQVSKSVKEAMKLVGLSYEEFADRSPFELSGGQMRRVAIAGVLAFRPRVLILDEPTAGLDPAGKKDFLNLISKLHKEWHLTTIIVSHSMDEVAKMADRLIVMNQGRIFLEGSPEEIFHQADRLQSIGLDIPNITKLIQRINQEIKPPIPLNCFSVDELERHLMERLIREKKR